MAVAPPAPPVALHTDLIGSPLLGTHHGGWTGSTTMGQSPSPIGPRSLLTPRPQMQVGIASPPQHRYQGPQGMAQHS